MGPFDEGFQLFFEETDWLLRAARRGSRPGTSPPPRRSTSIARAPRREPRAKTWFEESARRFRRRHYGAWFTGALAALDRRLPRPAAAPLPPVPAGGIDLAGLAAPFPLWVEVSPNPEGFPAAAELVREPLGEAWRLPAEIAAGLPAGTVLNLRVTDASGREVFRGSLPGGVEG